MKDILRIDFVNALYAATSKAFFKFYFLSNEAQVLGQGNHFIWAARKEINSPPEEYAKKKLIPPLAVPQLIQALEKLKYFPSLDCDLIIFIEIAIESYKNYMDGKNDLVQPEKSAEVDLYLEKDTEKVTIIENPVYGKRVR